MSSQSNDISDLSSYDDLSINAVDDDSSVNSDNSYERVLRQMFMEDMADQRTSTCIEQSYIVDKREVDLVMINRAQRVLNLSNNDYDHDNVDTPIPPSVDAYAASYQFLRQLMEEDEPGMFLKLPLELQDDTSLALAALHGTTNLKPDLWIHCDILKELCKTKPEVLCIHKPLFLKALERVDDICFHAQCILILNERGIVDDVYQELSRLFLFDNTTKRKPLMWKECYTGLLDVSLQCHPFVSRRFLESIPSKQMLQAIPDEAQLSEDHFVRAIMSLYRNDFQLDSGQQGTAFELTDIPKQFPKSRKLYAHLQNLANSDEEGGNDDRNRRLIRFRGFQFSFPPELCADHKVCLACLPGNSKSQSPKVWMSIDKSLREKKSFILHAIALDLEVCSWVSQDFDVWLTATSAHGYRKVLHILNQHQPIKLIRQFEAELDKVLCRLVPFWVFLRGISSNNNPLNMLCLDPETSTRLKREVAQYAGVPTGSRLMQLRRAWVMRRAFYA